MELAEDVAALHAEATEAAVAGLNLDAIADLCRILVSAGRRPEDHVLSLASSRLRAALASVETRPGAPGGGGGVSGAAAAAVALAVCEAGGERAVGAELVGLVCASGLVPGGDALLDVSGSSGLSASASGARSLGGGAAAALLLAAAACRCADASLLNALLACCSADECGLSEESLGDIRLAVAIADAEAVAGLDARSAGFLRTLCSGALLDDPRGLAPEEHAGGYPDALTDFEKEVSEALRTAEVIHCQGAHVSGIFVPMAGFVKKCAVFAEDAAARATFANRPAERTALQRWKYRAVAAAGWKVTAVSAADWRQLTDGQERAAHVRKLLQEPLDVAQL